MNDAQIGLLIFDKLMEQGMYSSEHNLRGDEGAFIRLLERKVLIKPTMLVLEVDGIEVGTAAKYTQLGIDQAADFLLCKAYSFSVLRAIALLHAASSDV